MTKTIFSTRGCFFSLTWAENEHWQPLVALRPLEAVKSFISCPCDTGKQPLIPKIVSDTGKMTNEWSKVLVLPSIFYSRRQDFGAKLSKILCVFLALVDFYVFGAQCVVNRWGCPASFHECTAQFCVSVNLFLEYNSWLIVEVGTRKNLFVIKLSWSKNCRIDCEIICCVMVCVYPCCLFLVGTQDAGWSMVTCTLFWGARIVAGEICVLNWLRDDTLCNALSKCLLFTFWDGSRKILWFFLVGIEWMEWRYLLIHRWSYAGPPKILFFWCLVPTILFFWCSWHGCYGWSYFICWCFV